MGKNLAPSSNISIPAQQHQINTGQSTQQIHQEQQVPFRFQLTPRGRPIVWGAITLASALISAACSAYGYQDFPNHIENGVGQYIIGAGMFALPVVALIFGSVAIIDFRALRNGTAAPQFHPNDIAGFLRWQENQRRTRQSQATQPVTNQDHASGIELQSYTV